MKRKQQKLFLLFVSIFIKIKNSVALKICIHCCKVAISHSLELTLIILKNKK